ncbi:coenzyme F420-reducing hydrogenase, alpha subunit [Desulfurobacterium pacificum]|uniref:Coenzyme F420-reducing hydrogenase, alpha subunit n=1 Tax=Desulfurobacterium pacificum TaxID=240166 RepID=A0ABY1NBX8_9BACT|nr:nickel-dependent hydrogenase large subunit [Desulfurobacterium pacificum]SMP06029.1 coenzyme F420-reducing hydrogenase, alpha subunit [Desulfurobacterium pacificum]
MKRIVKYEGIPLTEGHSGVYLTVEDGVVVDGYYYALVPVRGFETLLLGQEGVVAPTITSRICGLCQVTHAIAAARAIEDAAGMEIPEEATLLREVLGLAVRVYNNLLHQILISEDLFPEKKERMAFIKQVQKVRKVAGEVLESIGGEIIHPPKVRVGGFPEPLEDLVRDKVLDSVEKILPSLSTLHKTFISALGEMWKREGLPEDLGKHGRGFFATDLYYGKPFDINRITFKYPQEVFRNDLKREVTNLYPLIDGTVVETGARARSVLYKSYEHRGGVKELHVLRSAENVEAFERIKDILSSTSFEKELQNKAFPTSDGETLGVGVHEAPRGVNVHMVKLDKRGRIVYYKIVVPTEINFLVISESLKGAKLEHVDYIIRAYDPCVVCSVH